MATSGDEVGGDDGVCGRDVREVERGNWVEAESFSSAGGEEFKVGEIGLSLNKPVFSDDFVEFFGGLLEELGLV